MAVSDIYPMFIEPTITWVPSGFTGDIWLDTKIVLKKMDMVHTSTGNCRVWLIVARVDVYWCVIISVFERSL